MVRELELLPPGKRSALRAPFAALAAARSTRRADPLLPARPDLRLERRGDPAAAIRVAEYSGTPVAYSVAEHWFGGLYRRDQFMRHLVPGDHGLRALWGARGRELVNRLPSLRLEADRKVPASICWVSDALRRGCTCPETIEPLRRARDLHRRPRSRGLDRARAPPAVGSAHDRVRRPPRGAEGTASVAYRALAALRDRHGIDAQLKLAGRGAPGRAARPRPARHGSSGIEDRVELLGQLDQAGVGALMAGASAMRRAVHVAGAVGRRVPRGRPRPRAGGRPRAAAGCPRGCSRRSTRSTSRSATRMRAPTLSRACSPRAARPRPAPSAPSTRHRVQLRQLHGPDGRVHRRRRGRAPGGGAAGRWARRHLRRPVGSPSRRSKATS